MIEFYVLAGFTIFLIIVYVISKKKGNTGIADIVAGFLPGVIQLTVTALEPRKAELKKRGEWNDQAKKDLKKEGVKNVLEMLIPIASSVFKNPEEEIGNRIDLAVKQNKEQP